MSVYGMQDVVNGFIALGNGDANAAAHLWLEALVHAPDSAPLRGAVHNNAGVAFFIGAKTGEAAEQFAQAEQFWRQALEEIAALDVPIGSRSSVFHLRLAMDHQEALTELRRRRLLEACAAAQAITRHNARLMLGEPAEHPAAAQVDVLATAFGAECAEVQLLRQSASSADVRAAYRRKAELVENGAPVRAGFSGELECAARLTALLHPAVLSRAEIE